MAALKEWVRGLVMLVVLASILELLLPMSTMKKFVRMAMGLLIVLGVVRPVVSFLGQPMEVQTDLLVQESSHIPSMQQIEAEAGRFREKNERLLQQEAEARLIAEVRAAARKVEGVSDARVSLRLVRRGQEWQVEEVSVTVLLGSRYGQVRPVEPVQTGPEAVPDVKPGSDGQGPAEAALADAVRREVAARLGLTDARLIQVLVDRPGQPRR